MSNHEKVKVRAFTAITALAGVLIAIIANYRAFPELLFNAILTILLGVIVVLVVYAFLWERVSRHIRMWLWNRERNVLARKYFDDFRDFVERFTSLREFSGVSQGIVGILDNLLKRAPKGYDILISARINDFSSILHNPLNSFKNRLYNLYWKKKEINHEFLFCLVKEFENYVMLHKLLYVNLAVSIARKIGLENVPQTIKRAYLEYKDDYNQFVIAYTEFARKSAKAKLGIFSENLQKAYEL